MARQRKSESPDPASPEDPLRDETDAFSDVVPPQMTEVSGADDPVTMPQRDAMPPRRQPAPIWPALLGGVLAAAAGAGATVGVVRTYPGLVIPPTDDSAIVRQLADLDQRIGGLDERIATLPPQGAAESAGLSAEDLLAPVADRLAAIETELGTVGARLTALEQRPAELAPAAAASPDIAAAALALKEAEAAALQLKAEAAGMARQAAIAQALARIEAALESGSGLTDALAGLREAEVAVPEALAAVEQGAPTLKALRDAFPEAAREAIALSLAAAPDPTTWGRISAFLRAQTGARSLSPRAGDDPDAVLSRAEAALGANDLSAAIAEIALLPPEGQDRMNEWVTLAGRRLAAADALRSLRAEVQP
jgi:hypothetical protein